MTAIGVFIKKRIKILIFAAAAVILFVFLFFGGEKISDREFVLAKRGDIVQEVSVTGKVEPSRSVDLAFEKVGRVSRVNYGVGANVSPGAVLAEQDSSELRAQLSKAEADLEEQKSELQKAEVALENLYGSISDVINDAYTKANDAVRKQIDEIFTDDENGPNLTFRTKDLQLESDAEFARLRATAVLNEWFAELKLLDSAEKTDLEGAIVKARSNLIVVRGLLDLVARAVIDSAGLSQSASADYQADINTGRANINAAISNMNDQDQDIKSQKVSVASQSANVSSYEASVQNIKSQLAKTSLFSPISGVVTKQDAKVGMIVGANQAIVSVVSAGKLQVAANVPEADIAKLEIGDTASVTLDAYGGDVVFDVRVVSIDPAETVVDGVSTYKTTFEFVKDDARVKSGMTANINVITANAQAVIVVPQRAVITKNGGKFVFVEKESSEPEERAVLTGIRGSDGNIEIIKGIEEGEKIIISGI